MFLGFFSGRCVRSCLEDGCRPHRAYQASHPEPGLFHFPNHRIDGFHLPCFVCGFLTFPFPQDEMIKAGRLDRKYNGIVDCFKRTMADEGKIWY